MSEPALRSPRYLLGPLERRGAVLGIRVGHLVLTAVGAFTSLATFNAEPNLAGVTAVVVILAVVAAVALVPLAGRGLDEWLFIAAAHTLARLLGTTRWISSDAVDGRPLGEGADPTPPPPRPPLGPPDDIENRWVDAAKRVDDRSSTPPWLRGVELWAARWGEGEVGVLRDRRHRRWTSVLVVRGRSFELLPDGEKTACVNDWASVLASLARESSPLSRLQWLERTVPDDSDGLVRDFAQRRGLDHTSVAVRSYLALLDGAGRTTQQHELYLCATVADRAARAQGRRPGRPELGACEVLARELDGLCRGLREAGLEVLGVLGVRPLARLVRVSFDPPAEDGIAHRTAACPELSGAAPSDAYPQASREGWGELRVDGGLHRTYWVSEWPRTEVGADLMVPLLLRTSTRRTVSVVMAVEAPSVAMRRAQAQRHGDASTEAARQRLGFQSGARRQREQEGAVRREAELATGHALIRYSAYITVSATGPGQLRAACEDVERQARASGLEVRPEYGVQAQAFTFSLPLGRGLR